MRRALAKKPVVTERRVCEVLGQSRGTQRYKPKSNEYRERLRAAVLRLAGKFGRYGYRRVTAMLREEGFRVNPKTVEWIWRKEGLKVLKRQKKRGRPWLGSGSCVRLKPLHRNHVWSYDFVRDRTHSGVPYRTCGARAIALGPWLEHYSRVKPRGSLGLGGTPPTTGYEPGCRQRAQH